jgi:hypothetical protein
MEGDVVVDAEVPSPLSAERLRDVDETRRLLYALCFVEPGDAVPYELCGTVVNALAHHVPEIGFTPASALRLVRSVVDAPASSIGEARLAVGVQIDALSALLSGRVHSLHQDAGADGSSR